MIPGFPFNASGGLFLDLSGPDFGVDVWQRLGSPAYPVSVIVRVRSGVTIGSVANDIPALDFSGFAAGSVAYVQNLGRIQGRGGNGGKGDIWAASSGGSFTQYWGSAGGGGAGTAPGTGGITDPLRTAPNADSGTAIGGGAPGTSEAISTASATFANNEPGEDGGDAIFHGSIFLSINNIDGEIWGGGGGGGGSQVSGFDTAVGGAGGDPGQPGDASSQIGNPASPGGAAGYAVKGTGSRVFISGGTSPNVEGPIGAG